jgi:hypothetical protein
VPQGDKCGGIIACPGDHDIQFGPLGGTPV